MINTLATNLNAGLLSSNGYGALAHVYNAKAHGCAADGVTDDTAALQTLINTVSAAGGGTIFFPAGTYLIGGALQSTGTVNAQLVIPAVDVLAQQVNIRFAGPVRPPVQFHPAYDVVLPVTGYATIKSTLTGASGTAALIGGIGGATDTIQGNTAVSFENLIFQMPSNPTLSCINCINMQANEIRNVLIHCGTVDLPSVTQPTHSNAYGVKLPDTNHTPWTKLEGLTIFGMYTGIRISENTSGDGLRIWGCYKGVEVASAYHPSVLTSLGVYWTPYGIVTSNGGFGGRCFLTITLLDLEHANGDGQSWQNSVYDLDDPSNLLYGDVKFLGVSANVGNDHTFAKNGGTNFVASDLSYSGNASGWWDNNGAITSGIAAYAPKGAASLSISKLNLIDLATHTLTSSSDPTFSTATGWTFNGSSNHLLTDILATAGQTGTFIVKFNTASGAGKYLVGASSNSTSTYGVQPIDDSSSGSAKVAYLNGSFIRVSPSATSGVLAVRGSTANRNGVDEGSAIGATGDTPTVYAIGAMRSGSGYAAYWTGVVTSIAFYSAVLTQAEVAAVAGAMP